jgi:hypothetical protein
MITGDNFLLLQVLKMEITTYPIIIFILLMSLLFFGKN